MRITKRRRVLGLGLAGVGLAIAALLAVGSLGVAGAQDSSAASTAKAPALDSTQKQCLLQQGLTFLQHNSGQSITPTLVQALRQAIPDAAQACGVTVPKRSLEDELSALGVTGAQIQCVLSQGVPLPQVAPGQRPTKEQLQTLRQQAISAAQTCGITLPPGLTTGIKTT